MQIESEIIDYNIMRVRLSGRMDVLGVKAIEAQFSSLTDIPKTPVLIDLSQVDFLVSLGIRILLNTAKSLSKRGGYMVLYNPQPNVLNVLNITGTSELIPVYNGFEQAAEALARHQGLL